VGVSVSGVGVGKGDGEVDGNGADDFASDGTAKMHNISNNITKFLLVFQRVMEFSWMKAEYAPDSQHPKYLAS
jgi:hypothetical protein